MAEDLNKEDGFLDTDNREEESEPVGNPAPPSDVDLDLLRGDRIGDTVYSGKWCIQTVMKMLKSNVIIKPEEGEQSQDVDGKMDVVDMEEELQNEVGVLWDMTSNVEVCLYLQSVGAIESIYHVIANSRCPRATEMCVGMLGNIITHDELWHVLQSDSTLFAILIPLFSSTDQPVLLELSRFFTTAMSHSEMGDCYASMCSHGPLVTQELVRILSGSTNCDLLKLTTELTHTLMCVDDDDSHFNAIFADPDFIAAVLEASKEIGYDHETSSQSCVMEILHGFTTYPAGISAMETCMESITEAITKYLRSLCHSVNISSSGDTISIIITLLNHIFCRSLVVRIELMSSSKLLQYILKILIALYRRLGLYDSVANAPHGHHRQHRHHHHNHHQHHHHQHSKHHRHGRGVDGKSSSVTASESWESLTNVEEEDSKSSREGLASKSWSERAGAGETTPKHVFVTPDPSPKHVHATMKEVDFLSWSERRMASPLVDGGDGVGAGSDVWKIPQETKKLRRKRMLGEKDNMSLSTESTGDEGEERSSDSINMGAKGTDNTLEAEENMTAASSSQEKSEQFVKQCNTSDCEDGKTDSTSVVEEDYKVKGIEMVRESTDSHKSTGFSPCISDKEMDESMEFENTDGKTEECRERDEEVGGNSKTSQEFAAEGGSQIENSIGGGGQMNKNESVWFGNGFGDEKKALKTEDDDDNNVDEEEKRTLETWARDGVRRDRRPSRSNMDKYHTLLHVVREFLSDFFNNFREGLLTEQGIPVITDVLSFLDTQCRSSTLRILVHCVGPSHDISTPVGRLVHLTTCLNAANLRNILMECKVSDVTKERNG